MILEKLFIHRKTSAGLFLYETESRSILSPFRAKREPTCAQNVESTAPPLPNACFFLTLRQFRNIYTYAYDQTSLAFGTRRFPRL